MTVVTLPEPPPTMSVVVVRAWQYGLVLLADPSLNKVVEDFDTSEAVTASSDGVVIEVMAGGLLDVDEEEEESWEYRTVTVYLGIGSLAAVRGVVGGRPVLVDAVILTPSGSLALTDGQSAEMRVPAFPAQTRVLVSAATDGPEPTEVWIDLMPV